MTVLNNIKKDNLNEQEKSIFDHVLANGGTDKLSVKGGWQKVLGSDSETISGGEETTEGKEFVSYNILQKRVADGESISKEYRSRTDKKKFDVLEELVGTENPSLLDIRDLVNKKDATIDDKLGLVTKLATLLGSLDNVEVENPKIGTKLKEMQDEFNKIVTDRTGWDRLKSFGKNAITNAVKITEKVVDTVVTTTGDTRSDIKTTVSTGTENITTYVRNKVQGEPPDQSQNLTSSLTTGSTTVTPGGATTEYKSPTFLNQSVQPQSITSSLENKRTSQQKETTPPTQEYVTKTAQQMQQSLPASFAGFSPVDARFDPNTGNTTYEFTGNALSHIASGSGEETVLRLCVGPDQKVTLQTPGYDESTGSFRGVTEVGTDGQVNPDKLQGGLVMKSALSILTEIGCMVKFPLDPITSPAQYQIFKPIQNYIENPNTDNTHLLQTLQGMAAMIQGAKEDGFYKNTPLDKVVNNKKGGDIDPDQNLATLSSFFSQATMIKGGVEMINPNALAACLDGRQKNKSQDEINAVLTGSLQTKPITLPGYV